MSQSLSLISVDGQNPWILDSGATDHLTSFSEHFVSYTSCAGNEKIWIANGSLAPIVGKGQIVLFDGFSLHNVLHVPKLFYNLLSISKITRELYCKATFLPESVCFQDLSLGRAIGTARHSMGLYINALWKQRVVAKSSAEAEYRAMSLRICEEIWLQKVLSGLHQECETPLKLFCDHKAAISIANNPI
ncbi:hypothetical protein IC582_027528 [Cucumis melo]